jgi:hypothetical protein
MAHSNYADKSVSSDNIGTMTEHRLNFGNDARGFTPTAAEGDKPGHYGNLVENSTGDWSWKPHRYAADPGVTYKPGYAVDRTASLEAQMPTLRATPKGAAELYRREAFPRS